MNINKKSILSLCLLGGCIAFHGNNAAGEGLAFQSYSTDCSNTIWLSTGNDYVNDYRLYAKSGVVGAGGGVVDSFNLDGADMHTSISPFDAPHELYGGYMYDQPYMIGSASTTGNCQHRCTLGDPDCVTPEPPDPDPPAPEPPTPGPDPDPPAPEPPTPYPDPSPIPPAPQPDVPDNPAEAIHVNTLHVVALLGVNRSNTISDRLVSDLLTRNFIGRKTTQLVRNDGSNEQRPLINTWVETRYVNISDDRYGRNSDGDLAEILVGADRLVGSNAIVGLAMAWETGNLGTFGNFMETDIKGPVIGPYFGYQIGESLVVDTWLGYSYTEVENRLDRFEGDTDLQRYFISVNATGLIHTNWVQIQPKLSFYYSRSKTDGYNFETSYQGRTIAFEMEDSEFDYGTTEFSTELNKIITLGSTSIAPYLRAGVRYDFERPYDGNVVTSQLTFERPSAWSGNLRAGLHVTITDSTVLELSGSYLSISQDNLDIWEGRASFSFFF